MGCVCCCCQSCPFWRRGGCFHPFQRLGSFPRCYWSELCSSGGFSWSVEEARHSTPHRDKRKSDFSIPGKHFYSPRREFGTNYIRSLELRGRAVPLTTQGPPFPPLRRDLPWCCQKTAQQLHPVFLVGVPVPREEG